MRERSRQPIRIHLIGVAGSGMSGLASLMLGLGHKVSGSDRTRTKEIDRLERAGLVFAGAQSADSIADAELVVYSSAIKPGNAAFDAAVAAGIPMMRRAEALAALLAQRRGIVVAGTHGKTTTSALAAHVLRGGGLDPSHYVGAEIPVLGTNAHWSIDGEYMVAEGDESDGTLVNFHPEFALILNIEEEHLDHYTNGIVGIREVFQRFASQTTGAVIYCAEDPEAHVLCVDRPGSISFGWDPRWEFSAEIVESRGASTDFIARRNGREIGTVTLGIPGAHNVLNALAVIALATKLGVAFERIAEALHSFRGAKRRFEVRYRSTNFAVVDDYGHHPTEIRATVRTALATKPERLICVFQPHRYSRTQLLRKEFGTAFRGVDMLYVTGIYAASEVAIPGISGQTIVDEVLATGQENVRYLPDLETAHLEIGSHLREGDMVLTLGAGNIHEIATILERDLGVLDELRKRLNEPETELRLYEPMSRHTTMKVGGPAQYWISPRSVDSFAVSLRFCAERAIPVRVVGRGSNLLIRDGGIPGAVIHPSKGEFEEVRFVGNHLVCGVGARFKLVSAVAKKAGIGGFEWMEGIPGSVGGGLRMNAGAMGRETFDHVVRVSYLDRAGNLHEKAGEEFAHQYRNVPEFVENYAVQAEFDGESVEPDEIERRLEESVRKRRASQPVAASAGCIFKNPETIPAGRLVEELGLKNAAEGAARVSEIHGNFIVNDGGARASQVLSLIARVQAAALQERGIALQTEVQILGQDAPYR